jgi:hypothetical protein
MRPEGVQGGARLGDDGRVERSRDEKGDRDQADAIIGGVSSAPRLTAVLS